MAAPRWDPGRRSEEAAFAPGQGPPVGRDRNEPPERAGACAHGALPPVPGCRAGGSADWARELALPLVTVGPPYWGVLTSTGMT